MAPRREDELSEGTAQVQRLLISRMPVVKRRRDEAAPAERTAAAQAA
jgi:hypothetical protein